MSMFRFVPGSKNPASPTCKSMLCTLRLSTTQKIRFFHFFRRHFTPLAPNNMHLHIYTKICDDIRPQSLCNNLYILHGRIMVNPWVRPSKNDFLAILPMHRPLVHHTMPHISCIKTCHHMSDAIRIKHVCMYRSAPRISHGRHDSVLSKYFPAKSFIRFCIAHFSCANVRTSLTRSIYA